MWYKTHDLLVKALGIAIVSFLLMFMAVMPIYQNALKVTEKIRTKTKELETVSNKVAILSKLDKNVLADRVAMMDAAIPPKKDVLLYLTSIDGLSRELGLTLGVLSLTPGAVSENEESKVKNAKVASGGLQSLATEVQIQGGKDSIYTFLRKIENVLPLMQIKDISVNVSEGDSYSLSLSLGMLYALPEASKVSGAITLFGEEEDQYFSQLATFKKFEPIPMSANTTIQEAKKNLFAPN